MLNKILAEDTNIADLLKKETLDKLADSVMRDYEEDKDSRKDWEKGYKEHLELTQQATKKKTTPFEGCANVKYPLLSMVCIQFATRVYPAMGQGNEWAKVTVTGNDPNGIKAAKAGRIRRHMNYQLTQQMENWEDDMDTLLQVLPIGGTQFKKTYFDPRLGHNVSELVMAPDLVINQKSKRNRNPERATHVYELSQNEVEERVRRGLWHELKNDDRTEDEEKTYKFLEQHRLYDLDGDGYLEPYIVLVWEEGQQVVRIVRRFDFEDVEVDDSGKVLRINPVHYFTKYPIMPAFDGTYMDIGFGHIIAPINNAIDSTLNRLLDAGTLANMQGGFLGKGAQIPGGSLRVAPGEWKRVNISGPVLRDNIVPITYHEPSQVLFQLLGLLIESGEKLSSIRDVMTGDLPAANVSHATVTTLIEQGLQLFTGIQKRIHRAQKEELKKLYRLNSKYLNPTEYFMIDDEVNEIYLDDYTDETDVQPASDPTTASNALKLARASALFEIRGEPGFNREEINRQYLEGLQTPNIEKILQPQGPQPEQVMAEKQIEQKDRELEMKEVETEAKVVKMGADSLKAIALAKAAEEGSQIAGYEQIRKELETQAKIRSGNDGKRPQTVER